MIFQDPMSSLNPVLRVGDATSPESFDPMRMSTAKPPSPGQSNCSRKSGSTCRRRFSAYPHQFSGGMRRRIMIAMALAANPGLLLADEPTTALDVVVQAGILGLINGLRRSRKMSLLFVSHDLAVVSRMCDRIAVMYAGSDAEEGPTMQVLHRPRMPYTIGLLNGIPGPQSGSRLAAISGFPPQLETFPPGLPSARQDAAWPSRPVRNPRWRWWKWERTPGALPQNAGDRLKIWTAGTSSGGDEC